MHTSKRYRPLCVYLQRPDTGDWVTVGHYAQSGNGDQGSFSYAASYHDSGLAWAIDPINLPLRAAENFPALRYRGLNDVLRDASPDSWGQSMLKKVNGLGDNAHPLQYLVKAGNRDRWGALAVGLSPSPSVAHITHPDLSSLEAIVLELRAMASHQSPVSQRLRKLLTNEASLGGARPKCVIKDDDDYWIVKPLLRSDTADIPLLEHMTAELGRAAGLAMAETVYEKFGEVSVLRIKRFDRRGNRRLMAISGATLLETEFPGNQQTQEWSYPRLAEQLLRIGAGADRQELFLRMVFNAVVGNDDDHPRNHAAIYDHDRGRWCLSKAFDIVPSWDFMPDRLAMQTSMSCFTISRPAILQDAHRFGIEKDQAAEILDQFLRSVQTGLVTLSPHYPVHIREFFEQRIDANICRLMP